LIEILLEAHEDVSVGPTCKSWKKTGPLLADRKTLPALRVLIQDFVDGSASSSNEVARI
jgi:hypothetical protein